MQTESLSIPYRGLILERQRLSGATFREGDMADSYLNKLLSDQESILLIDRQHWLVLAGEILAEALLTSGLVVLITLLVPLAPGVPIIFGYGLLILPLLSMARDILIWANHQYIVTSRRVIQISGVLNKNVTDSSLEKVNDVKMHQSLFGRMLDYGDVEILTASELGVNLFRLIGQPIRFKTVMMNAKEKLGSEPGGGRSPEANTASLLEQLDSLRKHEVLTEAEFQAKKADILKRL